MKLTALNGTTVYVSAANVASVEPLGSNSRITTDGGASLMVKESIDDVITAIDAERVDNGDLASILSTIATNIGALKTTTSTDTTSTTSTTSTAS